MRLFGKVQTNGMKFTRQFDQMDCGPACICMVASAYGKDYPLSYLRTLSHLTREGVSVSGIRHALEELGMDSATFGQLPINSLFTIFRETSSDKSINFPPYVCFIYTDRTE